MTRRDDDAAVLALGVGAGPGGSLGDLPQVLGVASGEASLSRIVKDMLMLPRAGGAGAPAWDGPDEVERLS